jgi:integrase
MSVYKRADGIYVYDFQIQGVRFFGSTGGREEAAALKVEDEQRVKARAHLSLVVEQRTAPMTVNVAFDRFWVEVGDRYSGNYRKTVWASLVWLSAQFGPKTRLSDIGPSVIAEVVARRRGQGVKNATVNRTVTELVRRVLKRAEDLWEQKVKKIKWADLMLAEPKERVRELRDHEETKLVARMRDDYLPAIQFLMASGCRLNEAVVLRWRDIDFENGLMTVHGKGSKVAVIPLSAELRAILTPLLGNHSEKVFTYKTQRTRNHPKSGKLMTKGSRMPMTYSGLCTAWRRHGAPATGIVDFRLHDTRHTAATRLLRATGNLKMVQQLLRHEDIATTAKYAHVDVEDLRAGMELVRRKLKSVEGHDDKTGMDGHRRPGTKGRP